MNEAPVPQPPRDPGACDPQLRLALFGPTSGWSLEPVAHWLLTVGRFITDSIRLTEQLLARLDAAGAHIDRLRISCSTLHPQLAAIGLGWERGGRAQFWYGEHGVERSEAYIGSPVDHVHSTASPLHQRVEPVEQPGEHPIWRDLRQASMRDYLALPLVFSNGAVNVLTLATRQPQGFDADDVARLQALANLIAPLFELMVTRRTELGLLDTFVGKRVSERILDGQVRRGDGDQITAAFWYSDLRGFTALSESLPTAQVLRLLNDYFEHCAAAAAARGGEILQFIGDAILIVFEIWRDDQRASVCRAALEAAIDAFDTLAVVNDRRRRAGEPQVEFGLGLHVGTVTHGNVGAPNRLAFNVVGPAVNMTARIQDMTKTFQVPLLMSAEFAREVDRPVTSVGRHALRGIATAQELFRLANG